MRGLATFIMNAALIGVCVFLLYRAVMSTDEYDDIDFMAPPCPACPPCLVRTPEDLDAILQEKATRSATIGAIYVFVASAVSFLVYSKGGALSQGVMDRYRSFTGKAEEGK